MADCEYLDKAKEAGECTHEGCTEDGCGYKKKKKIDEAVNTVSRCDVYEDDWNFTMRETPEGYLMGKAVVTNIGVFRYINADGTESYELRLPEEVFSPDSMWSLKGKPITNEHPNQAVTVDNVKEYAVGMTEGDPLFDSYYLSIGVVINDSKTITDVKSGKRALSCGYTCDLEFTPGVYLGVPYTAIQRNIRYNHLAIVDKGRAGDAARLRIDSVSGAYNIHGKEEVKQMAEKSLRTITLDNVAYEAEDKVIDAYQSAIAKADGLQKTIDSLNTEKATIQAEKDSISEKLDTAQKELETLKANHVDKSELDARVTARIALCDVARKAEVEYKNADSDKDIMVAVIKKLAPKANLDGASDAYIQTRYEIVVEDMAEIKEDQATKAVHELNSPETHSDRKPKTDSEASRQAFLARAFKSGKKE